MTRRRAWRVMTACAAVAVIATLVLALATWRALMPLPQALDPQPADAPRAVRVVAADGTPLNRTFRGRLNHTATLPLARVPALLRKAFVASEDKRYWGHGGVDWLARWAALWGNLRAGHVVRGASTIGEQVARILAPRGRTYWSHWVAGFDASRLLARFGHARVLEFYLNQVPYGAQRRGVGQAARYYFGRDVGALDPAEQLALAVLVRSPVRYDPRQHPRALRRAVNQLAGRMRDANTITALQADAIRRAPITPGHESLLVNAGPFVVHAIQKAQQRGISGPVLHTTLDATLQVFVQKTLRRRVQALAARGVRNAAALVVDNRSGAVLAWAVAPAGGAYAIDPVLTPRQPGSALKPFVYGLAMARLHWQPDRIIMDTPLAETIAGTGVHRYRNYSGRHYGPVSLRYALANSLNIPAVRTAQAVGVSNIVRELHAFGFSTLRKGADYYGPAIVLGDGAVTLHDLVQGYASLARHGQFLPLHVLEGVVQSAPRQVLPAAVTSLLASILSDPDARAAEFGPDSVLDLPVPTALKTGTSSDYHNIWTAGFDNRYTVGVWMGNLAGAATDGLTGSMGPAPVVRQVFAHLRAAAPYAGLWHSPKLRAVHTCEWIGPPACIKRQDWYLPSAQVLAMSSGPRHLPSIARPLPDEELAIDPRVPIQSQRLRLVLDANGRNVSRVAWQVDGASVPGNDADSASWVLAAGRHEVTAHVWLGDQHAPIRVGPVAFSVSGP